MFAAARSLLLVALLLYALLSYIMKAPLAADVDIFLNQIVYHMMDGKRLSSTMVMSAVGLAIAILGAWAWAGAKLPPAWDVGRDSPGQPANRAAAAKRLEPASQNMFRAAAGYFYKSPPLLTTVTMRSLLLNTAAVTTGFFLLAQVDKLATVLTWLSPRVSLLIGGLGLLVATVLGSLRQSDIYLMINSAAMPAVDHRGKPLFLYVGTVPGGNWLHSPWARSKCWIAVMVFTLLGSTLLATTFGSFVPIVLGRMIVSISAGAVLGYLIIRAFERKRLQEPAQG